MTVAEIVVVGHPSRTAMAAALAKQVGANLSWDKADIGAARNHQQAWGYLANSAAQWSVVLEDDAMPVAEFRHQLHAVLAKAPDPIVSLYLGRGRPDQWQLPISSVITNEVCFLRCSTLFHAVGYAVRTSLLPVLLKATTRSLEAKPSLELTDAITRWAKAHHTSVCYCRPSIVNHRDGPPVIADADRGDRQSRATAPNSSGSAIRKAWLCAPRAQWDSSLAILPDPDLRRRDKIRHLIAVDCSPEVERPT